MSINPLTEKKTPMANYKACHPERSEKALPTNNLALIVQRTDFYFSNFSLLIMLLDANLSHRKNVKIG